LKVITEAIIRAELKATTPEVYYIPEGKLLSPAAREYLNQMQVDIDFERNREAHEQKLAEEREAKAAVNNSRPPIEHRPPSAYAKDTAEPEEGQKAKYVDYETGAGYTEKPEFMTQIFGNKLVDKNHPRIKYRGQLDFVQAEVVNAQCVVDQESHSERLIKDLDDILDCLRKLMVAEIMEQDYDKDTILGLTHEELREHSHNPMKFYNIKQMMLPDHTMGIEYSLLNKIRTEIRVAELVAVDAFQENRKMHRIDIIEELNRLSSALHIMMCKYLAGEYGSVK
jgi:ethanolamine utilization cobalamin adenosyltransferase